MNTDEARYFLAICEYKSLTQAAHELFISPQGLSRSIKRFEGKLGVRLFVRTGTGMVPTEVGKRLAEYLQKMVDAEDEAYRYLGDLKKAERTRYLVGRDSMLGDIVSQGVADYNEIHGEDAIRVIMMRESEDHLAKVFIEGGYDYRFLSSETDDLPDLPHEELCTLHIVPLVNRESEAAQRGTFALTDLRKMTVLVEYRSFPWVRILEQSCQRLGFDPKIREIDKDYIARLLSRPGDEITFVRDLDLASAPWNSPQFVTPEHYEPVDSRIVLQSIHPEVDSELVACLRKRFAASPYDSSEG